MESNTLKLKLRLNKNRDTVESYIISAKDKQFGFSTLS